MKKSMSFLKLTVFLAISCCFLSQKSNAQDSILKQKSEFWKKVRFGGGIGLGFGNGNFNGSLAPSGIYQFNDKTALGVSLNASYIKQRDAYKSTILGAGIIGLYNPIKEIQLSGEYEQNNVNIKYDNALVGSNATNKENYWSPALFLGAGYRAQQVTFGIRYDVLHDEDKSIYANPWMPFVRVYF